jgi:hypothetical protein
VLENIFVGASNIRLAVDYRYIFSSDGLSDSVIAGITFKADYIYDSTVVFAHLAVWNKRLPLSWLYCRFAVCYIYCGAVKMLLGEDI